MARGCRHHHGSVRDCAGQNGRWEQYGTAFSDTYLGTNIKIYSSTSYVDMYIENRQFQPGLMGDRGRAPHSTVYVFSRREIFPRSLTLTTRMTVSD